MSINEWLSETTSTLIKLGVETARLDALIMLEDALGKDRASVLAQPEAELDDNVQKTLDDWVIRRSSHEPLAYIRSKAEFYGRTFEVNDFVLVPRPETETMIDMLKSEADSADNIVDIGTGSGILAITAKLEFPRAFVAATDVDERCLSVARRNAENLYADIKFYQSDLLEAVPPPVIIRPATVMLANLPYVPDELEINQAARHEPSLAIFGGANGLDLYRQLFDQLNRYQERPVFIFTESLTIQHSLMKILAERAGYHEHFAEGLIQAFRL